jgi:hypothetical protein
VKGGLRAVKGGLFVEKYAQFAETNSAQDSVIDDSDVLFKVSTLRLTILLSKEWVNIYR